MTQRRRKLAALLLTLCLHACAISAARAQGDPPPTTNPVAFKFDEFGDVPASDIAARLDNFANALMEQPQVKGFVIAYRSRRDLPGLSGRLMSLMRNYLINSRGIDPNRVAGVDGGAAGCIAQELWLVPPGATPKPRDHAHEHGFVDIDSTRKFDEEAVDPSVGSYSQTIYHSLEGFANALRKEPRATGHIIAYSEYRVDRWEEEDERGRKRTSRRVHLDPPGTAARDMRHFRAELTSKYGISLSRIKLVNGGYRQWKEAELWIVPPGGHAPTPTPTSFPRGRR
jgi:hypothetical protein